MNFSFARVHPFSTPTTRVFSTSTTRSSQRHPQNGQTTSSIFIPDSSASFHQFSDGHKWFKGRSYRYHRSLEIRHSRSVSFRIYEVVGIRAKAYKNLTPRNPYCGIDFQYHISLLIL